MTTVSAPNFTNDLRKIINEDPSTIRAAVAREALDEHYNDPADFFFDLMQYGCVSGMVNSLVWYSQTHRFFDNHYDEIEDLRQDVESNLGEPFIIKGELKNCLAWFAFEETAFQMALKLGLEV